MSRYASFASCVALACLVCSSAARAQIIASDSYSVPPYTVGGLNGQPVGGTGFTGNWTFIPTLLQDLSVAGPGVIGRPTVTGGNSGDFATFAGGGTTITSGQLFISYDINSTAALNSSRMDLNVGPLLGNGDPNQGAYLGGLGFSGPYEFATSGNLNQSVIADSGIPSIGAHHLVGVLDFTNDQISIFVDPTASSYYQSNGLNDANATVAWTPPATTTITGYSLVDNFSDQASFSDAVFALDPGSVGIRPSSVPEPGSIALLIGMGVSGATFLRRRKSARNAA